MAAVAEIAESEGLRLKAYRCPAGKWTIAWGETDGVRPGDTCSKEQADRWLLEDVTDRAKAVRRMCIVEPSENELGALVSLAYNIGLDGLKKSTVLRQHNAGNRQAAARAFGLWNKARNPRTGQLDVLDGLTARRARESALYLTPDDPADAGTMPQAVEAESSLAKSPINAGGATAIGLGGVIAVSQVADQVQEASGVLATVKGAALQVADFVGVPPGMLLALGLVAVGWLVISNRVRQRREGWA
jgi:lysozyme